MTPELAQQLCKLIQENPTLPVHFVQYADDWFKNERYVSHTVESVAVRDVLVDYNEEYDRMELVAYGGGDITNKINSYVESGLINVKDVEEYRTQNTQKWILCGLLEVTL